MSDNAVVPNVFIRGAAALTNSRDVAAFFGKQHQHVLRDIDKALVDIANIRESLDCPKLDSPPTFTEVMVADGSGILRRTYDMDRDAFTLLAMGFTGAKALAFKVAYIAEFNRQEAIVAQVQAAARPQLDFTPMVDVIRAMGERQDALMERVLNGQTQMLQAILAARAAPHPNAGKNDNTWNRKTYPKAEAAPQAGLPNQTPEAQPRSLSRFRQGAARQGDIDVGPFYQGTAGSPCGSGGGPHSGSLSEQCGAGFGGVHAGLSA